MFLKKIDSPIVETIFLYIAEMIVSIILIIVEKQS